MSNRRHFFSLFRSLPLTLLAGVVLCLCAFGLQSCAWEHQEDFEKTVETDTDPFNGRDPLPGELVMLNMKQDSLAGVQKAIIKNNMNTVIQDFASKYKSSSSNGYFITDLNSDNLPELWIKTGNNRGNATLNLFYPNSDDSLKRSSIAAQPGKYYLGPDYILQVVPAGPAIFSINKITIRNGEIEVEKLKELDLYENPEAKLPDFKEPELRSAFFTNITPLTDW